MALVGCTNKYLDAIMYILIKSLRAAKAAESKVGIDCIVMRVDHDSNDHAITVVS